MEGYPGKHDFLLFLRIHHDADVYAPIASCLCSSRFVKKAEMETPLYISYFLGKTKIVRYKSKHISLGEKMDLLQICSAQIRCKFVQTGE